MKKFILIFLFFILSVTQTFATTLEGSVTYTVETARKAAFENVPKTFDIQSINIMKRISHDKYAILRGQLEVTNDGMPRKIQPFYKNGKLKCWGAYYKGDANHCYYYTTDGLLVTVDVIEGSVDKPPYKIMKYTKYGYLLTVAFSPSGNEQFVYKANGKLIAHWIGNKAYDKNGKELNLTRKID